MVLRWAAEALLATEANCRRIDEYRDRWVLKAGWMKRCRRGRI
jgi:hypothetical protein